MPSEWQIRASSPVSWRSKDALKHLHLNTEVLKPTDIPTGSALVRIRAAAINARDVMVIAHDSIYPLDNTRHLTPCADGAGEVEAVGEASVWKVGDRVMVYPFKTDWGGEQPTLKELQGLGAGSIDGTLRQYCVFSDDQLLRAPANLSFEQIASLPVAAGTAMRALFFGPKPLQKGMIVLTQGTGGVSCFAIQLAAAAGATVIATSSSDEKLEFTKRIGATHTINYVKTPEWDKKVLKLTEGKGVDIVVEVGGGSTIEKSISSTKQGGLISSVGNLTENKLADLIGPLLFGGKILWGVFGFTKEHNIAMAKMFEENDIKPVIGQVFEFKDAVKAFDVSMDGSTVGKIVIKV